MTIEAAVWWAVQQAFASAPRLLAAVVGLSALGYAVRWLAAMPGLARRIDALERDRLHPDEFARAMESHNARQDALAEGIQTILRAMGRAGDAAVLGAAYATACMIAPSAEMRAREWRVRPEREGDQG